MAATINQHNFNNLPIKVGINSHARPTAPHGEKPSDALPTDQVNISEAARRQQAHGQGVAVRGNPDAKALDTEEQQQVTNLKQRDMEVKAHEAAHMSAGSTVVQGGASYQYQTGPDGRMYAIGGEVSIDTSSENTPEATIRKMQEVRRAALAPAQPSGTDRAVAAQAAQVEAQARIEKTEQAKENADADQKPETDDIRMVAPLDQESLQRQTGLQINLFA